LREKIESSRFAVQILKIHGAKLVEEIEMIEFV
jgi:hypothetical protein